MTEDSKPISSGRLIMQSIVIIDCIIFLPIEKYAHMEKPVSIALLTVSFSRLSAFQGRLGLSSIQKIVFLVPSGSSSFLKMGKSLVLSARHIL